MHRHNIVPLSSALVKSHVVAVSDYKAQAESPTSSECNI